MRLDKLYIKNFRRYKNEVEINFDDLTLFIGKNDSGKSTILEALEIFFNNDIVKIDNRDSNIFNSSDEVQITTEFSEIPRSIVIDASNVTTLKDEYLLTANNTLKIRKKYNCGLKGTPKVLFCFTENWRMPLEYFCGLIMINNGEIIDHEEEIYC